MSRNKAGREMENKRTPIGTRPHSHSSRADSSLLLLPVLLWKESVLVGPWEPNLSPTSQTKPGGPITHFPPHCSSHQLSWLCLTYSFLPSASQAPGAPHFLEGPSGRSHIPSGQSWDKHIIGRRARWTQRLVLSFLCLEKQLTSHH